MGKSTISMAIFHCYVSSPEGKLETPMGFHGKMIDRILYDFMDFRGFFRLQRFCGWWLVVKNSTSLKNMVMGRTSYHF